MHLLLFLIGAAANRVADSPRRAHMIISTDSANDLTIAGAPAGHHDPGGGRFG